MKGFWNSINIFAKQWQDDKGRSMQQSRAGTQMFGNLEATRNTEESLRYRLALAMLSDNRIVFQWKRWQIWTSNNFGVR